MNFALFQHLVEASENPVILLEGTRAVEEEMGAQLSIFAAQLATQFPRAIFRSGNADGADSYFAQGMAKIDPIRLQLVVPQASHRRANRPAGAAIFSLDNVEDDADLVALTLAASPTYGFLAQNRASPKFGVKFAYLLRDTLKVAGHSGLHLAPATVGLFFVNEQKPKSGGTTHTMRVCEAAKVAVVEQQDWLEWIF